MPSATMAIDREVLYGEVWAEPMTKVAARYGVSSSYLACICDRLNVPRPARGYWPQLAVGRAPAQAALPEPRPGDELAWYRDDEPRRVPRALPKPPESGAEPVRRPTSSAAKSRQPRVHALLVGARTHFEGVRETDNGYLRPTKRRLVDLFVSVGTLDRALTLANTFFLALERRGHRVTLAPWDHQLGRPDVDAGGKGRRDPYAYHSWSPDRPTVVYVGPVAIGLTFFELSSEADVQYVDGKYVPVKRVPLEQRLDLLRGHGWTHKQDMLNGKLCLRASSPYAHATWEKLWPETKKGELRSMLPHVIQELASAASTIAALVEEGERRAELQRQEWERQQEQWRREAAERRRVQNIKDSREQLGAIIEAWGAAKRVEGFFEDAQRRAASLGDTERDAMLERLHRARELLGDTDALRQFLSWKAPEER